MNVTEIVYWSCAACFTVGITADPERWQMGLVGASVIFGSAGTTWAQKETYGLALLPPGFFC